MISGKHKHVKQFLNLILPQSTIEKDTRPLGMPVATVILSYNGKRLRFWLDDRAGAWSSVKIQD